jgi:hypothetical protein
MRRGCWHAPPQSYWRNQMKKLAIVIVTTSMSLIVAPANAVTVGSSKQTPATGQQAMTPEAANAQLALAELIREARAGRVDYSRMEQDIVPAVRSAQPQVTAKLGQLGEVVALTYRGQVSLGPVRAHKFDVQHARGRSKWRISLGRQGKISNIDYKIER